MQFIAGLEMEVFALLCMLAVVSSAISTGLPLVQVEHGVLRGTYQESAGGRKFAAFRGVPYAQPPVGEHRFKEPQPLTPWKDVWDATQYGSACLQYDFIASPDQIRVIGDEDCLFVNVFTPKIPTQTSNNLLDVVVFIHGGVFMNGEGGFYGPRYLLDHDVVFVTINYRLGVLGFLSTEDEVVPGNNGLKDQSAALRWIQRNIAAFGGNPARVTITGLSAGGASVNYHYLSPLSRGLFHQGVSISGSTLLCWAKAEAHRSKANKLGEMLGCSTQSSHELIECLRNRPARKIVQQTEHFQVWRYNPLNPFGPIVEVAGRNPFLSKHPIDVILDGEVQNLPWMTSVTTEEGLYPVADFGDKEDALKELDEKFNEIAPYFLHYNYTVPIHEQNSVSQKIRKFYFGEKPISKKTLKELTQLASDRIFVIDTERAARLVAAVNSAPVYFYKFSYRGHSSWSDAMSRTTVNMGVSHGDDLAYIINVPFSNTEKTQQDKDMSKLLLDIYLSFVRTGNPTPKGRDITWKPVTPNSQKLNLLHIASPTQMEMTTSEDLGNRVFWDSLPLAERTVGVTEVHNHADEL